MFGLKKEQLELVEKNKQYFYNVLKKSLKVKDEEILIISDYGEKDKELSLLLGYGYYLAAKEKGLNVEILFQEVKKGFMHTDQHVVKSLEKLNNGNVIILNLSNKLGRFGEYKSFRTFCKDRDHRFISATGLGDVKNSYFNLFIEAINLNYSRLKKKGEYLKKIFNKAHKIQIKTTAGTDITFNVEGMQALANVGEHQLKGTGGNVPSGEVYIPPKGYYGVDGIVVVNGSIKTMTGAILLNEPVKLLIKEGRIIKIEGEQANLLEKTFQKYENRAKYPFRVRHVCELGIGINPGAVLIGSTIMDEKVLGTAHIGIGSNAWFGGEIKTVFHGDYVFKKPIIYVDGKKISL